MKSEDIYNAVTDIRDDLVAGADRASLKNKARRRRIWRTAAAVVLVAAVTGGLFLLPRGGLIAGDSGSGIDTVPATPAASGKCAVVTAQYPKMAPFPDMNEYISPVTGILDEEFDVKYDEWWSDVRAQRSQTSGYNAGLDDFSAALAAQLLSGADGGNRVCSPVNIYMALGMLAETTGGNSRQQILDLLDADSIETLRERAKAIWNANYLNDTATESILADSLWLNEDLSFNEAALAQLAETYYASSFSGKTGSDEMNEALRAWLNEQTGGLLEDQLSDISLDPETVMALASTVYFRSRWQEEFLPQFTTDGVFHSADGDLQCEFMHQTNYKDYSWGENFSSVTQTLTNVGGMRFILPDEGVTVDELLQDDDALEFIVSGSSEGSRKKAIRVNETIPKFDVSSQFDLRDGLEKLGVTDVFSAETADFSPLLDKTDLDVFLSKAQHGVRVAVDEEGCTAAAYTVMELCGAGEPPPDEVDFVLDRPFIFVITGFTGDPMFIGVVNNVK